VCVCVCVHVCVRVCVRFVWQRFNACSERRMIFADFFRFHACMFVCVCVCVCVLCVVIRDVISAEMRGCVMSHFNKSCPI